MTLHHALTRKVLRRHHGREIKTIGDAFMVEFSSALSAVDCAIDIQRELHGLNQKTEEDRRIDHRIGIHLGDVTERRGDLFGDGVNIAARLEPLAAPGTICVSEDVANQLRSRPTYQLEDLGPLELKNILRSIHGFLVRASSQDPARSNTAELVPEGEVLLNYAPADDWPLYEGQRGWVSQLYRCLSVRVEQLSGEPVQIARHPGFTGKPQTDAELQRHLADAKAMVSVFSPPFVKRDGCVKEVREFFETVERSGGLWVENKSRFFKVMKAPVFQGDIPSDLNPVVSQVLGFDFFDHDPATGRVREFDESLGEALKQRFHERLYDLAYEVCQVLRILKQLQAHPDGRLLSPDDRRVIYLAPTTSDLEAERDRIRRELLERGHMVLPVTPPPLTLGELEREVRGHLEKCSVAIHLLGANYGITPEDSEESLPSLQVKWSADRAAQTELKRFVWLAGDPSTDDPRQQKFLQQLQVDTHLHLLAEIIERDLSLLKREVIRSLEPPKSEPVLPSGGAAEAEAQPPRVYLICEARDEESIEPLEDYLFALGLEVCLPAFDGADADAEALHRENLLTCEAVMIYFGAAPRAWVDIKLRELLKASGYGRKEPFRSRGVFIAPPMDHRKERFRSHQAQVIRQGPAFQPDPDLEEFVEATLGE